VILSLPLALIDQRAEIESYLPLPPATHAPVSMVEMTPLYGCKEILAEEGRPFVTTETPDSVLLTLSRSWVRGIDSPLSLGGICCPSASHATRISSPALVLGCVGGSETPR